jgi:hypothetical protein
MEIKCVECEGVLNDDVEYLYKGKSYCDDCYRASKKLEAVQQENGT